MKPFLYSGCMAMACLLMWPLSAAAQIYRWTDASGQVHYTQTAPAGPPGVQVAPAPAPSMSPGIAEMKAFNQKAAQAAEAKARDQAKREQETAKAAETCERARNAISTLESRPPSRIAQRNEEGQVVRMTPEQYDAQLAKARAAAEKNCS